MIDALATNLVFQPLTFSRNRLEVIIDPADTTLTDRSGLRYALTLLVPTFPQSTDFTELTTLVGRERPPQSIAGAVRYDGAQFRIDEVLDGFLESQKPTFKQNVLGVVPTLTMPYCRREIVTGGVPAINTLLTRPKEWVFKGGLTNEDFAGWDSRFFSQYLRDTRQFLTWQPAQKVVSADAMAEEYLYFLLNFTPVPAQLRLKVSIAYMDGSEEVKTLLTLDRPSLYSVVSCPVGMVALGLTNTSKVVRQYIVWLSDEQDWRLSEVRTFVVDWLSRAQERFVLIENSLGGFDALRLLGQAEAMTTVRRMVVETDSFGASAIDVATLRVVSAEGDSILTVSTGYFERNAADWMHYMDELLYAQSMYLVTEKGHVPLLLTTSELVVHDDDADLVARTLVFQKAKVEQNYSQLPATIPQPARAMGWRGVGYRQLLDGMGKRLGKVVPIRLRRYYVDDGSDVKPITEKTNTPGDSDYLEPTPSPDAIPGSTPYPNSAISRSGTYVRSNCGVGMAGGPATIVVAAGKYGGEAAGDADHMAEVEYQTFNTQAYADQYGTCTAINEFYSWNVPDGHWHYRTNRPDVVSLYHRFSPPADMGNAQFMQDQTGVYVFRPGTNDLNFPAGDKWWYYYAVGPVGSRIRMKIYRNGVLLLTRTSAEMVLGGYEPGGMFTDYNQSVDVTPQSGDRIYVNYELI